MELTLRQQINKLQKRINRDHDPLDLAIMDSLKQLERLETEEGLVEFHKQHYCGTPEAQEILGIPYQHLVLRLQNYVNNDGRKRIAAIELNPGSKRKSFVVVKQSLDRQSSKQ